MGIISKRQKVSSIVQPQKGIATDAAHSIHNKKTQYRAIDLVSGEQLFLIDLGFQTVNIGEFLGVVHAIKYIIENNYTHKIIYTDSQTALSWVKAKKTASKKVNNDLLKAEVFLKAFAEQVDRITILHWNKKEWGEIPSDFGNK